MRRRHDDGHGTNLAAGGGHLLEQAKEFHALLPTILRHLFRIDGDDRAAELPLAQLRACALLCDGPQSMSAMSRELGVSLSAMTQLADRLERAGLVQRVLGGSDRRIRQLQLTEQGEGIIRFHEDSRIARVAAVFEQMSPADRQQVLAALKTLSGACGATRRGRAPAGSWEVRLSRRSTLSTPHDQGGNL